MILSLKKIKKKQINQFLIKIKKYKNKHEIPEIDYIIINSTIGPELEQNSKIQEITKNVFSKITLQEPKILLAKKSVSNFKIKKKDKIALFCSLRKNLLSIFLTKLIFLVCPQLDVDSKNISKFDSNYNFNFGLKEHLSFPEIGYSSSLKTFGLNINIKFKKIKHKHDNFYLSKLLNII